MYVRLCRVCLQAAEADHPLVAELKEKLGNKRTELEHIRASLVELNEMEDDNTVELKSMRKSVGELKEEISGQCLSSACLPLPPTAYCLPTA